MAEEGATVGDYVNDESLEELASHTHTHWWYAMGETARCTRIQEPQGRPLFHLVRSLHRPLPPLLQSSFLNNYNTEVGNRTRPGRAPSSQQFPPSSHRLAKNSRKNSTILSSYWISSTDHHHHPPTQSISSDRKRNCTIAESQAVIGRSVGSHNQITRHYVTVWFSGPRKDILCPGGHIRSGCDPTLIALSRGCRRRRTIASHSVNLLASGPTLRAQSHL